ncbi:hypothetical protein OG401_14635 [Kitasatospora purpeofusca]|uniref:hypothetical protein n=1 Tax=Kitasatospora purpeofusca TaxID=67352 RepID=UPI00225B687C|nr:hypothetical protein [Kitasatospora purpeofusca]MCX4685535.1 hypothetical protein [Kitasatospora purpeofusca]
MAAFGRSRGRFGRRGGEPLINGRVLDAAGLLPAVGALFMIMLAFAGFMFSFALHQQAGLGHSALRAGLCSAPIAVGFGAASLYWQRLPQRLHGVPPPLGTGLLAVGCLLLGRLLGDGSGVGAVPPLLLTAVLGLLAGCAYAPLFGRALARVAPADVADASGLVVTAVRAGREERREEGWGGRPCGARVALARASARAPRERIRGAPPGPCKVSDVAEGNGTKPPVTSQVEGL